MASLQQLPQVKDLPDGPLLLLPTGVKGNKPAHPKSLPSAALWGVAHTKPTLSVERGTPNLYS